MNRKEIVATVIVSAAFIVLAAILVWTIVRRSAGEIEIGPFVNICVSLASILTFVVMIYAVYMMRQSESSVSRYEEYALKRKEEESRKKE